MDRTYYAGVLALPAAVSWQRVAHELSLIDARRDTRAVAARASRVAPRAGAVAADTAWLLPVFFCIDDYADLASVSQTRRELERYLDVPFLRFDQIDPRSVDDAAQSLLLAASDTATSQAISPASLRPQAPVDTQELIGLDRQAAVIEDLGSVVNTFGRSVIESCNLAFLGGPGTGKTALAQRLIGRLDELGITDGTNRLIRTDVSQLIGRYVGHTAPKTKAQVERALGGVLYIDEAYALTNNRFGQECIDTLVDLMDLHRRELVCVFAGYENGINRLLDANEGLRERVPYRISFPGYSNAELARIFRRFATVHGFALAGIDDASLADAMACLRRQRGFAQARSVRNLFQDALVSSARRGRERVITSDDLAYALMQRLADASAGPSVGFTSTLPSIKTTFRPSVPERRPSHA